tara:strand:- start:449 stop:1018 length:570 start_codon:yes stop_codon:yes gene_type:complete
MEENDEDPGPASRFHSLTKPEGKVKEYIGRIFRYTGRNVEVLVSAIIYILRLSGKTNMQLSSYNLHRLLITSVTIAMKYLEDKIYSNRYMAKVGGITLTELNDLEASFLLRIGYDLQLPPLKFEDFCFEICQLDAAFLVEKIDIHLAISKVPSKMNGNGRKNSCAKIPVSGGAELIESHIAQISPRRAF